MKKILILSLTIFTLLSCSSSDDIADNSIIGTWKLVSHSDIDVLDECFKKTVIIFNSDNTFGGTSYEDCENDSDPGQPYSGKYFESDTNEYGLEFNNSSNNDISVAKLNGKDLIITEGRRITGWVKQ